MFTKVNHAAPRECVNAAQRGLGAVKRIRRPVSRVLFSARRRSDGHSSGPPIAGRFSRPTRSPRTSDGPVPAEARARDPYSVLLQAGLAMPSLSPGTRWALTPPFHPYRGAEAQRRFAFCGAIPGLAPGGRYPPPCRRGARTFLDGPPRKLGGPPRPPGRLIRRQTEGSGRKRQTLLRQGYGGQPVLSLKENRHGPVVLAGLALRSLGVGGNAIDAGCA